MIERGEHMELLSYSLVMLAVLLSFVLGKLSNGITIIKKTDYDEPTEYLDQPTNDIDPDFEKWVREHKGGGVNG